MVLNVSYYKVANKSFRFNYYTVGFSTTYLNWPLIPIPTIVLHEVWYNSLRKKASCGPLLQKCVTFYGTQMGFAKFYQKRV